MARMARNQTNIQTANNGLPSVQNQRFNHVVPNVVGADAGKNPFAGDLTNAFNSFFGGLQDAMANFQQAEFEQKKVEAADYAKEMQAAGVNAAREIAQENPKMGQQGLQVAVENMEMENDNRHFISSYKQTLGASVGDRMYGDFALHMSQKPAANFESEAMSWWQKEYGKGTGDEIVDQAMSAAWARNYETARVKAAGEAIAKQKQATYEGVVNDAYRRISAPDWNWNDYAAVNRSMASLFPNETNGQVSARTLGILKAAAVANGEKSVRGFISFLNQKPTLENGEQGQSIAERFPAAVAKLRDEAYDNLMAYTTLSGQDAFQTATATLTKISSEPDEYTRLEQLTKFEATQIPLLQNTPGVPFAQIGAMKTEVAKQISAMKAYKLNMNALEAGTANGGSFPSWFGVDDAKKYGSEFILRKHDFLNGNGDPLVATKAGQALQTIYNRFGDAALGDEVKQMFIGGLLNANPETIARTVTTLKTMDPTGNVANALLSGNARALSIFNAANVAPTPDGDPVQAAIRAAGPEVQASLARINEKGLHNIMHQAGLLSGKNEGELKTALQNEVSGAGLREALEESLGFDSIWDWDSWGSPKATPQVLALMERSYTQAAAQIYADPNQDFSLENIRNRVAQMIKGSIEWDGGTLRLKSGVVDADRAGGPDQFQRVPLGNSVYNPDTGKAENTSETLRKDMQLISTGLVGLDLDTDNIGFRQATHLGQVNGFQIIDKNTDLPMVIALNAAYKVQQQFKIGPDGRPTRLGFFAEMLTTMGEDDTVKFTGDREHDQQIAELVFGPGIGLRAHTDPSGNTVGYQLFVAPRFEGRPKWTMADVERLAKRSLSEAEVYRAIRNAPVEDQAFLTSQYWAYRMAQQGKSAMIPRADGLSTEDAEAMETYLMQRGIMP